MLVTVLDKLRDEASGTKFAPTYIPADPTPELTNQSRTRAFIHLYLKVAFGLLGFAERERFVTDGAYDGGIDGYFINNDLRTVYFIQSKFRTTQSNFETKKIRLDEVLVMDINRILGGEPVDHQGNEYNGKIKQMQREISQIEDVGRYRYVVVLLANLDGVSEEKLKQLSGGYPVEIIDYERCYSQLVFPVLCGTYFNASDLQIYVDLSNKNAGAKISYAVTTAHAECEITVLFVPTIEVAKMMHRYKNSILAFNPRSYLELEGQAVNAAIRDTILNKSTNEFALFNNGLTVLSDETHINERIGQKNKAQLTLKNPQIINGGQTAYTLSRIYEEHEESEAQRIFAEKEVLLKVITLMTGDTNVSRKDSVALIEDISQATNQQTPVISADRLSNEVVQRDIQKVLFNRYALLYERKRGEFADGLHKEYIRPSQVLERNLFFRLFLAANGGIAEAIQKRLFARIKDPGSTLVDPLKLDRFYFAYLYYQELRRTGRLRADAQKRDKVLFAKCYLVTMRYAPPTVEQFADAVSRVTEPFESEWASFVEEVAGRAGFERFSVTVHRGAEGPVRIFSPQRWINSNRFLTDVKGFLRKGTASPVPAEEQEVEDEASRGNLGGLI